MALGFSLQAANNALNAITLEIDTHASPAVLHIYGTVRPAFGTAAGGAALAVLTFADPVRGRGRKPGVDHERDYPRCCCGRERHRGVVPHPQGRRHHCGDRWQHHRDWRWRGPAVGDRLDYGRTTGADHGLYPDVHEPGVSFPPTVLDDHQPSMQSSKVGAASPASVMVSIA